MLTLQTKCAECLNVILWWMEIDQIDPPMWLLESRCIPRDSDKICLNFHVTSQPHICTRVLYIPTTTWTCIYTHSAKQIYSSNLEYIACTVANIPRPEDKSTTGRQSPCLGPINTEKYWMCKVLPGECDLPQYFRGLSGDLLLIVNSNFDLELSGWAALASSYTQLLMYNTWVFIWAVMHGARYSWSNYFGI